MYNQFLVAYVVSMVLWQAANTFVIKDQPFTVDVTHSTDLPFNNVSTAADAASSAFVIDEEEMQPVEKENNETSTDETDRKKFNVEQPSASFVKIETNVEMFIDDDDDAKSTVKDEKQEERDSSSDSDEEPDKLRHDKYSQPNEEDDEAEDDHVDDE